MPASVGVSDECFEHCGMGWMRDPESPYNVPISLDFRLQKMANCPPDDDPVDSEHVALLPPSESSDGLELRNMV